jgi:hypothetical protein
VALDLQRHRPPGSSSPAGSIRTVLRVVIVVAIVALAAMRGFGGLRLVLLGTALLWALLLPVALGWFWRATSGLSQNLRYGVTLAACVALLGSFFLGVRALLAIG